MLITPTKWQKLKEDRDHDEIMRRDKEAFRAFQRGDCSYLRLRRFYLFTVWALALLTLVFLILMTK